MATITRENVGLLTDKVSVTLSKEEYYPSFEKALKNYAKQANISGFRKGMVPLAVVKRMYGSSVFTDELLRTVEKEMNAWMEKERPAIFGQPLPTDENSDTLRNLDINNPQAYTFSFELGLQPEVTPASLTSATIKRQRIMATEEMVTEEMERLQNRHGKLHEPEAVDSDGNILNVSFEEIDAEGNVVEDGIKKDNSLLVKYFAEAFRPQISGLKVGDSFNVVLGQDFEAKERDWLITDLGLTGNEDAPNKKFKLTITKLGQVEKRELNEEFFNKLFPEQAIATEAEFRDALKADIQKQLDNQTRPQVHDEIYHYLINNTSLTFPEAFLKKWLMTSGEKLKTAEEADEEYPKFIGSLTWSMISNELEKQAQIKIEPEELRLFARQQMMGYMGMQSAEDGAGWIDQYVDRMMQDKKFVDENYNRLFTEKLFAWAESQIVNFNDEIMTLEEYNTSRDQHQH